MKSLLLPLMVLLPLLLAAQTIPHQINVLDIQPDGADKEILEVGALGGQVYWSVTGDVNYLSNGTVAATTSFPGSIGFRSGLVNLGQVGDHYYFYYNYQGKGYYAGVDSRIPAPLPLRFPLLNKDGFAYTNPVLTNNRIYVIREHQQASPARHVLQILELNPATEGAAIVYADTVATVAHPTNGRLAELNGRLYFTHIQSGGPGPATYDVGSGTVTDLGILSANSPLSFRRAGSWMLLDYADATDQQVSRLINETGSEAIHATTLQTASAVALQSGIVALGVDGILYAADYTSGATSELAAGHGTHPLKLFQVNGSEALYARVDAAGAWVLGRTDGTPTGTRDMVTIPSTAATGPQEFAKLGEFVAFLSANHPLYLFDLNTEVLQEVAADCSRTVADPGLGTIGDRLYFAAEHPDYGREIHYLTIPEQTHFSGTAFRDDNGNGTREDGEPGLANIPIVVVGGTDTRVYTDTAGRFTLLARHGEEYTITTDAQDCYFNTSSQKTYVFTYSVSAPPDVQFAFQPEAGAASLHLQLNSGRVRCNTDVPYWLTVYNDGCLPVAGTTTITLPDHVKYLEAEPAPSDTSSGREITFIFDTLQPGQTFYAALKLRMPDETFAGTDIEVGASAGAKTATGIEAAPITLYTMPLRCAVDPNDKLVSPAREEPTQSNYTQLDEAITYTIRFQNTGNDTAFDVRIEDQLSADLDLNTFRPLGASHPYTVRMQEAGHLVFRFDNIFLPDSNVNLVGSEGFVSFEIMARPELPDFTVIENTAAIYFDFNKPVITNTVHSTLVAILDQDKDGFNFYEDCDDTNFAISPAAAEITDSGRDENCDGIQATTATAVNDVLDGNLMVYPNPAGPWLHLEHSDPRPLTAQLIDATGRQLLKDEFTGSLRLATADYPAGVYLLRVTDAKTGAQAVRRVMIGE